MKAFSILFILGMIHSSCRTSAVDISSLEFDCGRDFDVTQSALKIDFTNDRPQKKQLSIRFFPKGEVAERQIELSSKGCIGIDPKESGTVFIHNSSKRAVFQMKLTAGLIESIKVIQLKPLNPNEYEIWLRCGDLPTSSKKNEKNVIFRFTKQQKSPNSEDLRVISLPDGNSFDLSFFSCVVVNPEATTSIVATTGEYQREYTIETSSRSQTAVTDLALCPIGFAPDLDDNCITTNIPVPTFKPMPGNYSEDVKVGMEYENPQAQIYYTTDGQSPGPRSNLFKDSIPVIGPDSEVLFRALAINPDGQRSPISNGNFRVFYQEDNPDSPGGFKVQQVEIDGSFVCALDLNKRVYWWGLDSFGSLGQGSFIASPQSRPGPVAGFDQSATQLALGTFHACVIAESASREVYCWGQGARLGNRQNAENGSPNSAKALEVTNLKNAILIGAGHAHTCALLSSGTSSKVVECWGDHSRGQIGRDTPISDGYSRKSISFTQDILQISSGAWHNCVLTSNGQVWCWGDNRDGQLGKSIEELPNELSTEPTLVSLPKKAISVSAGGAHSCALLEDSHAYCWGRQYSGQLGDNVSGGDIAAPVAVVSVDDFLTIHAGSGHTCGISASKGFLCWGSNTYGELGNGDPNRSIQRLPATVLELPNESLTAAQIKAGNGLSCAILPEDSSLWCFGRGEHGELGQDQVVPDTVIALPVLAP